MKRLFFVPIIFVLFNCTSEEANTSNSSDNSEQKAVEPITDQWTSKAMAIDDEGWGYQLFRGSHLEINQKNVPAINGLHYFETKEKAEIAAEFALKKIEEGFFPPTVSPFELDSIGAINLDSLTQATEKMIQASEK